MAHLFLDFFLARLNISYRIFNALLEFAGLGLERLVRKLLDRRYVAVDFFNQRPEFFQLTDTGVAAEKFLNKFDHDESKKVRFVRAKMTVSCQNWGNTCQER